MAETGWDPMAVWERVGAIPWVRDLQVYPEVGSTNDVARALGEMGAPEGVIVLADAQTAGRGRAGRSWWTPPGTALALSLLVRPRRPAAEWSSLTMIAALAAVAGVEAVGCPVGLKWPNDIMIPPTLGEDVPPERWRKAGGVLVEALPPAFAVVGIGLNINVPVEEAPPEIAGILGSLHRTLGRPVSRLEVLAALLRAFADLYLEWNAGASVLEQWAARLIILGRPVRILGPEGAWEGIAESVDAEGGLWVRRPDGERRRFLAGDVSLRGVTG